MKSRLINVRLDGEHLRKARALRERGIVLSDLMRDAIDSTFEVVMGAEQPGNVQRMITEIFERYPDPEDLPPRDYDVHDREAAREAIRRKMSRRPQ